MLMTEINMENETERFSKDVAHCQVNGHIF